MPTWLLNLLIPVALKIVKGVAVPAVEKEWPFLVPIINGIIDVLGGTPPSNELRMASDHFNALQSNRK